MSHGTAKKQKRERHEVMPAASWPELSIRVPASATTLEGFRAWALSDEFPQRGRISFLQGDLFIDMSPEELDTHNRVKSEVTYTIAGLNKELDLGHFYSDGTLITNPAAGHSTEPDGTFVSWQSYEAGRVRRVARKDREGQSIELQGTPDWVVEIVSRSSVEKDTRTLRESYHRARVPEYWIIDARFDSIDFQILRYRRDRYVAVSPRGGWLRSRVFGRGFRLERGRDRLGFWEYTLRVTPD
jgi:Uma2 family endonuclease